MEATKQPSATNGEGCQPGVLVELRDTLKRVETTGYGAMHGDLLSRCVSWIETLERQCLTYEHAAQNAERTIEALQRQQCSFEKRTVCSFALSETPFKTCDGCATPQICNLSAVCRTTPSAIRESGEAEHLRMQIGYIVTQLMLAGDKRSLPEIVEEAANATKGKP